MIGLNILFTVKFRTSLYFIATKMAISMKDHEYDFVAELSGHPLNINLSYNLQSTLS